MAVDITKRLNLFETSVLIKPESFSGSRKDSFQVTDGSRMIFSLQILSIGAGASVDLFIRNTFAVDIPLTQVLQISGAAVGNFSKVLTDFHNIFEIEVVVSGGTAELAVGVSIVDNANATRIENAVIETSVSAYPGIDGEYDSVRVSDGTNEMHVNPNGSIDVNIVDGSGTAEDTKEVYGEALAVATSIETLIAQYTVGAGKKALVQRIDFGGSNIAEYRYYKNGTLTGKKRTFWSGPFFSSFDFFTGSEEGMPLAEGDQVQIKVVHVRAASGDFEARIQYREITV